MIARPCTPTAQPLDSVRPMPRWSSSVNFGSSNCWTLWIGFQSGKGFGYVSKSDDNEVWIFHLDG
ncbi:hypothetical protein BDY19DRAFT_965765 [Irpex rosettiformis]|uniref:Uncharacterized protein n=1 Tax=Irpex rosettiformis TaxID=378272 RepID=A0ACB8TU80_9APHY|nr:hypothetical protein BDY19DRAFT_965765 [Irpex rosettiformis]